MNYRIIILIFVLFSTISGGMIWYTDTLQENAVKASSLENAKIYSDAIAAFRTLYTSEVVSAAEEHGLEVTFDYVDKKAIPLPATLSILLAGKIGEGSSGANARLYSPYPFPWREETGGLLDDFSNRAWNNFSNNGSDAYYEFDLDVENNVLRYAVADRMRESCVNCHNSHADSPKIDWKEGDVRGVLEVIIPLNSVLTSIDEGFGTTVFIYGLLSVLGIAGIVIIFRKHKHESHVLRTANDSLKVALDEIKTLRGIIPICSYCHNIRNDKGAWSRMEAYISRHSEAQFSHSICPNCMDKARSDAETE